MTDEEILALANAVSAAMRAVAEAEQKFGGETNDYTLQYNAWVEKRTVIEGARKALLDAKAALEDGLATR